MWNSIEQPLNQKLQEEIKAVHEKQQKIWYLSKLQMQTKHTSRKW
jgi:hypothetical protein